VIKKDIFYTLSKKNQAIMREVARKFCNELIRLARIDNTEALKILKKNGITFENPSPAQIISLQQTAKTIYQKHMGDIYSADLFQKVQDLLLAYRNSS
jgi:TRAP-type C4-dicarboxylate transport system substrate-binding protein